MKKAVIELNFFFILQRIKIPTICKKNSTFFRIGAIYKILTGITQKIWQPTFEWVLAARCKGPDKVNFFLKACHPWNLPYKFGRAAPPWTENDIFSYPVLETDIPNQNCISSQKYTNNPLGNYFRLDLMPLLAYRDLMRAEGPKLIPIF